MRPGSPGPAPIRKTTLMIAVLQGLLDTTLPGRSAALLVSPTSRSNLDPAVCVEHVSLRRRLLHVTGKDRSNLRIARASDSLRGLGQIVRCVSQRDVGTKQQPVGARLAPRHTDAPGIHDSNLADH